MVGCVAEGGGAEGLEHRHLGTADSGGDGLGQLDAYVHLATFVVPYADHIDIGAGALQEIVAHHATHGIGVDAHAVGLTTDDTIDIQPQVNHLVLRLLHQIALGVVDLPKADRTA